MFSIPVIIDKLILMATLLIWAGGRVHFHQSESLPPKLMLPPCNPDTGPVDKQELLSWQR